MRQSLKTRLLSAAYKAACALAEKVFAFTESIREKKDDSYLDDLYDHRDALAEELREGNALLGALERRLDNVRAELEITNHEIYGQDCPIPHTLADFDDLPAPQGVNEDEAPEGYKAVAADVGCTGCSFEPVGTSPSSSGTHSCGGEQRADRQEVVFQRR